MAERRIRTPGELPETLPVAARTGVGLELLAGSHVVDRGDHLVLRTPDNPAYHWGNSLHVTTGDPDDVARWLALFARTFPEAGHLAIGLPRAPGPAAREAWAAAGAQLEANEPLVAASPPPTDLPPPYVARPFGEAAWSQRRVAEDRENERSRVDPSPQFGAYLDGVLAARRRLVDRGVAQWFGVPGPRTVPWRPRWGSSCSATAPATSTS